ncbi:DUF4442 domain-containing protein [Patulibacter minatonensis]|uniref:DUF4442 domain-containing protein n=1 Tax=Patulibacter minatonensis TaxID=298163 RepID=UPI00047B51A9|nr:DUF4442 domain-containing protein [Patulibacter minatonensis]
MDTTAVAAAMLEPVPANRLFGIRVRSATPDGAEVELDVRTEATNVIGSLHASGLVAIADAAGLAAVLGAAPSPAALEGVSALGAAAELRFAAPARGRLVGRCALDDDAARTLRGLYDRDTDRATLATTVAIEDEAGDLVCTGTFDWRLRRLED